MEIITNVRKMDDFITARVDGYDEHMRQFVEEDSEFYAFTASLLPRAENAEVLDLGCGTTYWHSGINPGFQSLYVLYPEEDKYIVVITNSDRGLDFAKETARDYLGINGVWDIKRN